MLTAENGTPKTRLWIRSCGFNVTFSGALFSAVNMCYSTILSWLSTYPTLSSRRFLLTTSNVVCPFAVTCTTDSCSLYDFSHTYKVDFTWIQRWYCKTTHWNVYFAATKIFILLHHRGSGTDIGKTDQFTRSSRLTCQLFLLTLVY